MSSRKLVFLLAFQHAFFQCLCEPRGAALRQSAKEVVHPAKSETGLLEYERQTQSPLIWFNLHKSNLFAGSPKSQVN